MIKINDEVYVPYWDYTTSRDVQMKTNQEYGIKVISEARRGIVIQSEENKVVVELLNNQLVAVKPEMCFKSKKACLEMLKNLK